MFDPLPDSVIATLRSNETTALAAILIIGGSFPDILAFAARVVEPPQKPSCLVPAFDGASLSSDSKDALWARFFMERHDD
jgi:hypothetical protein